MKPKIIFTIVNFNTKQLLDNCVRSIRETQKKHSVFVIDNASTDGSKEMVKKKYPEVKLTENSKNIGFGAAHNIALKNTEYDFAVITNSDIIFLNRIEETLKVFFENKKVGACSIKLLNPDQTIQKNVYPIPNLKMEIISRMPFVKNPYQGYKFDYGKSSEVECFNGACFIANKKALDEIGFFDEDFFAYGEETDLFFRMKKKGWKICYCPDTKAIHFGGQTTKERNKRHLMYFKSLLLFFRKNHGKMQELALRAVTIISSVISAISCLVLSPLNAKKLEEIPFNLEIIKICIFG